MEGGPPLEPFGDAGQLALLDVLPEIVVVLDDTGRIRWVNSTTRRLMGYATDSELIGASVFDFIHPDDIAYMLASFEKRAANPSEPGLIVQGRSLHADGTWGVYEVIGMSLLDHPDINGMIISARDISRQSALADSPARLRSMVDRTTDIVLLLDADGRFVYANRRLTSLLGHDSDNVIGSHWTLMVEPDDVDEASAWFERLVASGDGANSGLHVRLTGPLGRRFEAELRGTNQLSDSVVEGIIVSARDIGEIVAMQRELEERNERLADAASHDQLTGLLNRPAFVGAVDQAISTRRGEPCDGDSPPPEIVVLFCDLDGFKAINDEHGHEVGDRVLQQIAVRLRDNVRPGDIVARYGGDEFTILLADDPPVRTVSVLVNLLAGAVREPVLVGPLTTGVGVSIGVSRAPADKADVDGLLSAADAAMYQRKRSTRARP